MDGVSRLITTMHRSKDMNVTKVKLMVDQALFDRCYFKDTVFYVTSPFCRGSRIHSRSYVFDDSGRNIGSISGYYFDFGDKKVFKKVDE